MLPPSLEADRIDKRGSEEEPIERQCIYSEIPNRSTNDLKAKITSLACNFSEILQTPSAKSEIPAEIFNGSTQEIRRIARGKSLGAIVVKADILQALSAELAKGFALEVATLCSFADYLHS